MKIELKEKGKRKFCDHFNIYFHHVKIVCEKKTQLRRQ